MYARITTGPDGQLDATSTCTIDGTPVPVPTHVGGDTVGLVRVAAAVEALDWVVVGWVVVGWDIGAVAPEGGWFEVLVDLPGANS